MPRTAREDVVDKLTSVTRLLAVEAALTALVFLEWEAVRPGEAVGEKRGSLTVPSAVLLTAERTDGAWPGSLSWAAASCDSWSNCDSWLDPWPLPGPPSLAAVSIMGGEKTRVDSSEERLVACESLLEEERFCDWRDRRVSK